MRKKVKIGDIILWVFNTVSILFLLWGLVSYLEVVCNNLTPGYDYWDWNLFTKLLEWFPK